MNDPADILASRLSELWRTSHPIIQERIVVLRAAHRALSVHPDDPDARTSAREAAHKLSGVLGTFGIPQGSAIAAHLEDLLKSTEPLTLSDLIFIADQTSALANLIAAKGEG